MLGLPINLSKIPMEPIQQDTWGESEPILYLLLGIGFLLTLIVAGVFVFIISRKSD